MIRDRNLATEIEPFSFIKTIDVAADRDCSDPAPESVAEAEDSLGQTSDLDLRSSALCNRKSETSLASLPQNYPVTISDNWYTANNASSVNNALTNVIILPEETIYNAASKRSFSYYLDRLLIIVASVYLGFVLWWLFISDRALFSLPWLVDRTETISQADAEFIEYMQQSLKIIDTQAIEEKKESSEQTSAVTFVPVFTPAPQPPVANSTQLPTLLPPPPPDRLAAINPPVAPIPIPTPAAPSESIKTKTTPNADPETQTPHSVATSPVPEVATTIKDRVPHTLVGVMELTENSAALFKIDGVTHRIWLGDKVKNTDWVLDQVSNQKVTISRQGKSLTLNIGEGF